MSEKAGVALSTLQSPLVCTSPLMFQPYRAIGLVCSDTPPVLHTLGTDSFLVTAIDKSFQVFAAGTLATRIVSPPVRKRVR